MNRDEAEAEARRQAAELLTAVLPALDALTDEGDAEASYTAVRARAWIASELSRRAQEDGLP